MTTKAKLVYFGDRIFYPNLNMFRSVIIKMYGLTAQGKNSDEMYTQYNHVALYRYVPRNDVSVNDGPHIRLWSHKNIIQGDSLARGPKLVYLQIFNEFFNQ